MSNVSYKNRVALNYIITTGILIFVVFVVIFKIVEFSVHKHINNDLISELEKHSQEVGIKEGVIYLVNKHEWNEREHNTVDVNPVFVQFTNRERIVIEKSPNLKTLILPFDTIHTNDEFFDGNLNGKPIRQIQKEILNNQELVGYLQVAMSLDDTVMILNNLKFVLWVIFPLILILIFLTARFIAARSIKPVKEIILSAQNITERDLSTRILLPQKKDELYDLSHTINSLLKRLELAFLREKQFTSDASHELRTPLAVIKGNLEILVRKPRTQEEYKEKVSYCLNEVDRLNKTIDELMMLARYDNMKFDTNFQPVYIQSIITDELLRFQNLIQNKNISIQENIQQKRPIQTDTYLLTIILDNLISNALKYSDQNGTVKINFFQSNKNTYLSIQNFGIVIEQAEIEKIFDPFFRTERSKDSEIKGYGIGLSIVQKVAKILNINILVSSSESEGTIFELSF